MRTYKFFAHFNRVNMQRGDPRVWTVHFKKTCYQVEGFSSAVPLVTRYSPNGAQPRAKLLGYATSVEVNNNIAEIR